MKVFFSLKFAEKQCFFFLSLEVRRILVEQGGLTEEHIHSEGRSRSGDKVDLWVSAGGVKAMTVKFLVRNYKLLNKQVD